MGRCAPLLQQLRSLLDLLLGADELAGVALAGVELVGGGCRTPMVQAFLPTFRCGEHVGSTGRTGLLDKAGGSCTDFESC